ncbi:hypothetical protein BGW80DRAFT_76180 [Lactifluus volemus]|nr:hypothetical protein BGW80DRAFT_76180 [Lactifluus volemus]
MSDADCPICMNHFKFQDIRSLPCGHTYCSACIDELIGRPSAEDGISRCPECRQQFQFDDIRRLFINSSNRNRNISSPQATSSSVCSSVETQGFVRQARFIARRLGRIKAESPVQSLKTAVDVIKHVATIQCKEAQEILWKAVREFWLSLVPYFEQLDRCEELQKAITGLQQRMDVLDQTCTSLRSEVEKERNQAQRYFHTLKDKDQEIAELRMALRRVEDENEWERQRHHTVLAHLRASTIKQRAQIKQLRKDLKTREEETATSGFQREEESLIIEPDVAYNKERSHRLDIYNEDSLSSKCHESSHEASTHAVGLDDTFSGDDLPDNCPSKQPMSPPTQWKRRSHTADPPEIDHPSPERPKFGSDWNLKGPRRALARSNSEVLPFPLDAQGRPKGLLKYGSRVRVKGR